MWFKNKASRRQIWKNLYDLRAGKDFFNRTQNVLIIKEKIDKLKYIKIKNSGHEKASHRVEKILAIYPFSKEHAPTTNQNILKRKKNPDNPIEKKIYEQWLTE